MNNHENNLISQRFDKEDLNKALKTLREGGVILYPTDTIWGLGCDARNSEAVKRIYKIKHREDAKSMLSLVGSEGMLQNTVNDVPDIAWQLIESAINPITIIYDNPRGLAPNLLADDGSAGIRITSEKFSQTLCQRFGAPIVSTSANISGEKSPSSFSDISDEIKQVVDYAVNYGREKNNSKASNIIKVSNSGIIQIIR